MNYTTNIASSMRYTFLCIVLCIPTLNAMAGNVVNSEEADKIQEKKDASAKIRREAIARVLGPCVCP